MRSMIASFHSLAALSAHAKHICLMYTELQPRCTWADTEMKSVCYKKLWSNEENLPFRYVKAECSTQGDLPNYMPASISQSRFVGSKPQGCLDLDQCCFRVCIVHLALQDRHGSFSHGCRQCLPVLTSCRLAVPTCLSGRSMLIICLVF